MTTELEQKFYNTFGIKPKYYYDCNVAKTEKSEYIFELKNFSKENIISCCKYKEDFGYCKVIKVNKIYPEITAEKLLEMICIYNSTYTNGYTNYFFLTERNVKKLKEQILKNCLMTGDDIKQQIQQLFNERKE